MHPRNLPRGVRVPARLRDGDGILCRTAPGACRQDRPWPQAQSVGHAGKGQTQNSHAKGRRDGRKLRLLETPLPPHGSDEGSELASLFLENADGFLRSTEFAASKGFESEIMAGCCYALELILKSFLLSRGRSDEWNRLHIRHDLRKALLEAHRLGLSEQPKPITRFIETCSDHYRQHTLSELSKAEPDVRPAPGYLSAVCELYADIKRRFAGG